MNLSLRDPAFVARLTGGTVPPPVGPPYPGDLIAHWSAESCVHRRAGGVDVGTRPWAGPHHGHQYRGLARGRHQSHGRLVLLVRRGCPDSAAADRFGRRVRVQRVDRGDVVLPSRAQCGGTGGGGWVPEGPVRACESFERHGRPVCPAGDEAVVDQLRARNYADGTLEGRRDALKVFLAWAAERDLKHAVHITRPILEAYQRALWRSTKANGQRLGWSTQRTRLGVLKDFFRWLTKQNVILHNPASEFELPRLEKRLPTAALTLTQVETLLAVPNVADRLGVRDRAMLELFYSCGLRRAELCRLELTDLNTERRTLTIRRGKGKKDRVVPVGARHRLARTLSQGSPSASLSRHAHAGVVPHRLRRRLQPRRGEPHDRRLDEGGRPQRKLPLAAPHLRHAHARRRRGHPLHPAVARTREAGDDGHLHRSHHPPVAGSPCPLPSRSEAARTLAATRP